MLRENIILGKKLLIFTAHPDDESFAAAGTIWKNHKRGGSAVLVCATLGEKGSSHLKQPLSSRELKIVRKKELQRVARLLRIKKLRIMDFPDGKVGAHRSDFFKKGLAAAKAYRPDCILSFGEDGISGHLDHIAAGEVAVRIAQKLSIPFLRFSLPPRFVRQSMKWLLSRRRASHYADAIHFQKPNLRVAIDGKIKRRALHCHASQIDEDALTGFPAYAARELLRAEYFVA